MWIPWRARIPLLLSLLLALTAVAIALVTLRVLWLAHWHGPFRDMWEIYPFLEKIIDQRWGWGDLWESYGYSHRLLVPKLLYVADYRWFDANNHLLVGVSVFCQVGIIAVFAALLRNEMAVTKAGFLTALALVVFFQFNGGLLFNFMHTFDVQWFLCCLLVVMAFAIQSRFDHAPAAIVWSALLMAIACLCNFSAMAAWPIWLIGLWRMHSLGVGPRVAAAAIVVLFVLIYGWGVRAAGLETWQEHNPVYMLGYLLAWFPLMYLSSPLSDVDYLASGPWSASLVVLAILAVVISLWHRRERGAVSACERFCLSVVIFCFGVAVMTAIGRGYDPSHVHASRYQNIVVLFWSAICVYLWLQLSRWQGVKKYLLVLPALLAVTGFLVCQQKFWNENLLLGRNVARSHLALMMGYSADVPMIAATVSRSMIYVPGYTLEKERALHERSRKGIYADLVSRHWLEGYRVPGALPECRDIYYSLAFKVTPYTEFTEFRVGGRLESYRHALLLDSQENVVAIAIREPPASVRDLLVSRGYARAMRGISRQADPTALRAILVSRRAAVGDCLLSPASFPLTGESL